MANFATRFKKFVLKVLKVSEWTGQYSINREFTFQSNAIKNQLWYNGDAYELEQFYEALPNNTQRFWGAPETKGQEIRRIHTGLPGLIVDTLVNITAKDINDITFKDETVKKMYEDMNKENNYTNIFSDVVKKALVMGDGAIKYTYDADESKQPHLEVYGGDKVDFVYKNGKIKEVIFYNYYEYKGRNYTLEERYGYGYIKYKVYRDTDEMPMGIIPQSEGLQDIEFDNSIILAVPFKFSDSDKYKGRGKSIYDTKCDAFDAVDECVSQWIDALRAGRTKTYIPDSLIPRDPNGGSLMKPNCFDNRFIKIGADLTENAKNQITTENANIQTDAYIQTYITSLDIALQGIISPSTLGIDSKKLDNAEAQREKEKVTLYTRSSIISSLSNIIKEIIQVSFNTLFVIYGTNKIEIECDVNFGEYANPSFEAVIETMSNPNTPMSIEAKVDEIWGNTKDEEWKEKEVERIKNERGIISLDEPAVNLDKVIPDDDDIKE